MEKLRKFKPYIIYTFIFGNDDYISILQFYKIW